jgi:hypothetical protein
MLNKSKSNNYLIVIIVVFFLLFSNIFVSASVVKKSENNIKISAHLLKQNTDEWFDGNFRGSWGVTKDYSDGEIIGNINLRRSSSVGYFFGEWNKFDDNSSGILRGIFRKNILIGSIEHNGDENNYHFIGIISYDDTSFKAFIFGLKISFLFLRGEYESSFLPPLTGNYGVGIKSIHLIDENRLEEFTPADPDDYREMMIQIWYPIDKEIQESRVEYMDAPTFAWLKGRSPVPLFTIPDTAYLFIRPHGRYEIPISNNQEMYPVIIFSPGYDGVYQIYTSLIEDIVSNGFVVVSINHPYISGITVFPDGRKIYVSLIPPGDLSLSSVVEDAKFVLDNVVEMNNSDVDFKGRFDLSRVGMYGHSYGGASTSICCYEDDRFLCGLTLDGVFYLDQIPGGIDKPFLLLLAENRFNDDNVQKMWDNLNSDALKVEIKGSTHYAYSDVGVLLKHLVPLVPINLLGFGNIEPKRHVNITRMIELMFFEVFLQGRSFEDLIDILSSYEEVQFEIK